MPLLLAEAASTIAGAAGAASTTRLQARPPKRCKTQPEAQHPHRSISHRYNSAGFRSTPSHRTHSQTQSRSRDLALPRQHLEVDPITLLDQKELLKESCLIFHFQRLDKTQEEAEHQGHHQRRSQRRSAALAQSRERHSETNTSVFFFKATAIVLSCTPKT